MFHSPLQPMWDLIIHPLRGPTSSLAHRPVSGSYTICNRPNPPLTYIVRFGPRPHSFKTCLLGRSFHTLIKNALFSSPTNVGSHNPPPLGPASSLEHRPMSGSETICNRLSPPLANNLRFGPQPHGFKTHLLGRGFHTLIKNVSFSSPTNVGSHLLGPSVLADIPPSV